MALPYSNFSQPTTLTLDLHFDELQSFFVESTGVVGSKRVDTRRFGPGFHIIALRNLSPRNTPQLGLYVCLEAGLPTVTVTFKYTWQSISGTNFPSPGPTTLRMLTGGSPGRGVPCVLDSVSKGYGRMVLEDNKAICRISIKYDAKDFILPPSSLAVLHSTLVGRMKVDISQISIAEFVANRRRTINDDSQTAAPNILSVTVEAILAAAGCSWDEFVQRGVDASLWFPMTAGSLHEHDPPASFEYDSDAEDPIEVRLDEAVVTAPVPPLQTKVESVDGSDEIRVTPLPENEGDATTGGKEPTAKLRLFRTNPTTMEAVLYWVITGRISLKPLRKDGRDRQANASKRHRPAPASCKSVYRIAHALGFKTLKAAALTYYETQLSQAETNVLDELFGPLSAQYVELKNLALLAVIRRWDDLKSSPALAQKMAEIASGKFPSAGQIMTELWTKVSATEE